MIECEVKEACWIAGKQRSPGDVVPLATHDAVYLAGLGRVERVTPAEPPAPVAEKPARKKSARAD